MPYKAPTPEDLEKLKDQLGYSSNQMASLFGLADGRQWRRYTSQAGNPDNRREMGMHMLFFAVARLTLSAEAIEAVLRGMRMIGAQVDLPAPAGEPDSSQP